MKILRNYIVAIVASGILSSCSLLPALAGKLSHDLEATATPKAPVEAVKAALEV